MPRLSLGEIERVLDDENLPDHDDAQAALVEDGLDADIRDYAPRIFDGRPIYNVQCISGCHVFQAERGSDFERMAIERWEQGYLGALTVSPSECPICIGEHFEYRSLFLEAEIGSAPA